MSTNPITEKIAAFITGLFDSEHTDAHPDRILVRHLSVNDRQADVAAIRIDAPPVDETAVVELARRLEYQASTDADGLGGAQRYVLVAMRGGEALGRLPFRMAGGPVDAGEAFDSEPATATGLVAQLMRHNEANSRIVSLSMGQVVANLMRHNERLQALVDDAEQRRLQVAELTEQLLSRQHERALELKEAEASAALKQEGLGKLFALLPVVAQHLGAGRPIVDYLGAAAGFWRTWSASAPATGQAGAESTVRSGPAASAPGGTGGIEAFLATLSQEQMASMLASLTPEQQSTLLDIIRGLQGAGSAQSQQAGGGTEQPS
jgi:hypothetical protein